MKSFLRAILICAGLILQVEIAFACSCAPNSSVLEEYEKSEVVLLGRVMSLNKVRDSEGKYTPITRSATVIVEKVYKGNVRVNDELVFAQGYGGNCGWSFAENDSGQQILFYVYPPKTESRFWTAYICSRTARASEAREDLLYLDNLNTLSGKTRVSGTYRFWPEGSGVANKKIRITGQGRSYDIKTDDHGVYEIYDLPPGTYVLQPEIPKRWRIRQVYYLRNVSSVSSRSFTFTLEPKKHVSINPVFEPDNAVEGRIVDPLGNPMKGVGVHLWTADESDGWGGHYAHTDANGEFRIESIDEGRYVLVVNPDGASSQNRYLRLFYPGVTRREKAAFIDISDGEVIKGINLVMPKVFETVTLSGVVRYSDDVPMDDARVEFEPVSADGIGKEPHRFANDRGQFELKVIKGLKGEISAFFYAETGQYENCPKLDALIKASGQSSPTITTPPLKIEAAQDLGDLVLRFPFPSCKRKQAK